MASKIKVDQIEGSTGSSITIPSGQTLTVTDGLSASVIGSGTLTDARIPNLNASKINAGTFADARIADLNASKLTGSIADARLPTVPVAKGGTGLTSLGSAGQVVKVNSGANALEFGDADGGGKILQVKTRQTASVLSSSTSSFVATDNYVQITPSATSSKIFVLMNGQGGISSGDPWCYVEIYRQIGTGSFSALSKVRRVAPGASATLVQDITHQFIDEPNTTLEVTYKVYWKGGSGSAHYNGRSQSESSIAFGTAMEIGA